MDASKKILVAMGILVFDFELFVGERYDPRSVRRPRQGESALELQSTKHLSGRLAKRILICTMIQMPNTHDQILLYKETSINSPDAHTEKVGKSEQI